MRKYKYTAVNIENKKFTGTFVAEDEDNLRQQLARQNLYLVKCKVMKDVSPNAFFSLTGKVTMPELTTLCRQFSIMLNSGVSILESLAQLREQPYSAYLKKLLFMIYDDVKVGMLLSKAMEKHKKVFPDFFRSMIYVGEISGSLDEVLTSLADYYENESALRRKIKGALTYPIVMAVMLVAIVLLMLLFIVPQFESTLASLNMQNVNPITTVVFAMSRGIRTNGLKILYGIVIVFALLFLLAKTKKGKMFLAKTAYKLPLIKNIQINLVASKFTQSMALLLASGMNLADSLEVVQNLLGNKYAIVKFSEVIEDVRQGSTLTFAMEKSKLFPQMLIQLLSTGEKSGSIDEVLKRSMKFFDTQVETALLRATSILQPTMLCLLGGVIALMFIAVYSPMIAIMQSDFTNQSGAIIIEKLTMM